MKRLKTILALAAVLCLLASGALADTSGVDALLSPYLDVNQDVRFSMAYQLKTLMPFDEDMTEMLNDVLKHVSVNTALTGEDMTLNLTVGDQSLMSFDEKHQGDAFTLTTSLLPNYTLTGTGDGLAALFEEEAAAEKAFDLNAAIAEAEGCYQALTDAIAPFAEEKSANYKIANVGHAKWVRLAKLSPEQSAGLLPQLIELLGCGMDAAFRQELQTLTCKNGFTIALYRTAEGGEDLAVYIKGNVVMGEDDSRTLDYQWAFSRENGVKDTFKLELLKNASPVRRRIIKGSLTRKDDDGKLTVAMNNTLTIKTPESTVTTTEKHSLKGQTGETSTTLSGSLSTAVKTSADGDVETVTTVLEPDLTLTSAEGSGVLSGTVEISETTGKRVDKAVTLTLDKEPALALSTAAAAGTLYAVSDSDTVSISVDGSSLAQNVDEVEKLTDAPSDGSGSYLVGTPPLGLTAHSAPASMQTVNLDSATPEEKLALQGAMAQNLAGLMLKAMAALPEEDARLLRDNMTDEDYSAFVTLLSGL